MKHKSLGWVIFSAAVLAASCTKDGQVIPPVIQATVLPSSGNTTQTFSFDLGGSDSRNGKGAKVFTRWDWDGNGTWDTPFTRILKYNHRYYAPGTWKPRLEMVNLDGGSDTLTISVPVERGYSPPKIRLTISPEKGHPFTRFVLDASRTFDDEDSLNQLTYKWDFEGDGQWDTPFGDSSKISFQYPETGIYEPKLQVKDPSGLISSEKGKILVNLEDLRLFVGFRCIPDSVTHNTPIIMDASACSDLDNPDMPLHYRWDWNNDRIWDTEWLTNPKTEHIFKDEFFNYVRLQIRSFRGLTNEMGEWARVSSDKATKATVHFFYARKENRKNTADPIFKGLSKVEETTTTGGLLWGKEGWKEEFLKEISEKYSQNSILKAENKEYRLVGLPLYNAAVSNQFKMKISETFGVQV